MKDVLSNDQVAALVEAAKHGQVPAPEAAGPRRRARRVREIDFSRPTKFAPDQTRRIERAHENFCRSASTHMAAELLTQIDLEVLSLDQLTWASSTGQIPQPSICAVLECEPIGTQVLMSAELPLLLRLVERQLGGSGQAKVQSRDLTDIELALVRRMFLNLLEQLSVTWEDLAGIKFNLRALESVMANVNLAPPSEPSLMLTMEAKVAHSSSTISLIFPYRSVEPVLPRLSGSQYGEVSVDPEAARAVRSGMAQVEVDLRAEVASRHLSLDDVLALAPGDVLRFHTPASQGVRLYAGHVPAHRAQPGRNGNRRAVQIVGRLEGGS
jgi:flagellar motor switch protein FliM